MSLDTDLRAALAGNAGITALVGTRIVADRMEEGAARPFIVFSRATTDYQTGLDGTVLAERATFDVQCWADTRASAEAVCDAAATAVRAAGFLTTGRRAEFDPESDLWAAVLSIDHWAT